MNYHPIIDRMKRIAELLPNAIGGITPTGTKTINITQNGTVIEDVTNFANAEIITNVPTVENCYITTSTLASHQSTNVTLCELPSYVYAHRNDSSFSVAMYNLTPNMAQDHDIYMAMANNNQNNPNLGNYPVYGSAPVKIRATEVRTNPIFYPPNSISDDVGLGGYGKFWISGNNLMYHASPYFLSAGTYKIIFTW